MQTLYTFCLLCSVVVLAVDKKQPSPTEVSTSNGLQCPTCQNLISGSCEAKPAFCHGEENFCVNSTGNILKEEKVTAFVTKGCVTQLALQALLGIEKIDPGTTYNLTNVTVTEAQVGPTETPEDKTTTEETTTEETATEETATEETPPKKPTEAAPVKTTSKGSPHISRGLSFALWLPIMSSVLWMTILS